MLIDNVNLNHVRVFECVYRTGSMTSASHELHLTQSGVSQHIKSLEEMLGVKLFDRISQRIVPTSAAGILYKRCSQSLAGIEEAFSQIKGGAKALSGTVSVGMPIEFGNNVVVPLLAKFGRKHPLVRFNLKLDYANVMNEALLRGDLDFAFVDAFAMDRRITTEKVYDEVLELCITDEALKKHGQPKNNRKWFESLDYVEYQQGEPILRMWFGHHLDARNIELNVKATVMDVQTVARLILSDLGAGVVPGHLIHKLGKEGKRLYRFKGCGNPVKNTISIAYLKERTHSPAATAALEWLRESFATAAG